MCGVDEPFVDADDDAEDASLVGVELTLALVRTGGDDDVDDDEEDEEDEDDDDEDRDEVDDDELLL